MLAAALLVGGAAALPLLLQPGLLSTRGGGDSPFLLQRLHQLIAALAAGHFPARWMPDAAYGLGYPFFHFYASLSLYAAAAFRLLGFSFVVAIELAQLAAFVTAAWAIFRLARRWLGSEWAGLLAAAAYTFAPFHLANVYVRGDSLAELWAMAFYPLVFLAADHLFDAPAADGGGRRLALFGLAYGGLILSHNVSALIFTPFLLLYLAVRAGRRPAGALAGLTLGALALGLALAAWFWLPALAERDLAQLAPVTAGYFHYSNHFRFADLVQTGLAVDYDVAGGRAFAMGLLQTAMIAAGLLVMYYWRAFVLPRRLFVVAGLIIATLMITPLSRPLWDHLPLLPYAQFPWRFLSVQAFFGALAAGALGVLPGRRLIVPALIAALALPAAAGLPADTLAVTDADVTAERLASYEWFTGNIGTTVSAEYLPAAVQPRPYTSAWLEDGARDRMIVLSGTASGRVLERQVDFQRWQLEVDAGPAEVLLPTLHWPGWQAELDGLELAIAAAPGSGLIAATVPAGSHTLALRLGRTPVRLAAELLSLAAVVVAVWLARPRRWPRPGRRGLAALAALGLLALGLRLAPRPAGAADDLNWDFEQLVYLQHGGVAFGDGTRLERYTYGTDSVAGGDELLVTLYWSGDAPAEVAVDLVTPSATRFPAAPIIAAAAETRAMTTAIRLPIPSDAPAGLVLPRLRLTGAQALTPGALTRGDVFLRPLRIAAQTEAAAEPALDARAGGVLPRADGQLEVHVQWLTTRPLGQNYNISLRLLDGRGGVAAQFDGQPGYGFTPSTLWVPGVWTHDWLALELPAESAARPPYGLLIMLYDVRDGAVLLRRGLGELVKRGGELAFQPYEPAFALPAGLSTVDAVFGEQIALRGFALETDAAELNLSLFWQALERPPADFHHFVHLVDPDSGAIVAQHDSMPRGGAYPTGQWQLGEVVADPLTIELAAVPVGEYELVVGLYQHLGGELRRLPVVNGRGQLLPGDSIRLPVPILIASR